MKKAKTLLFSLIALVMLFMVGCTNSSTPDDNQSKSEEILISVDYAPDEISGEYNSFDEEYNGYEAERIILRTNIAAKDFKFIEIGYKGENTNIQYYEAAVLYSLDELSPENPLVVTWLEQGTVPHRGLSFVDENNITRYFYIAKSGEDGSLLLIEFEQE